MTRFQAVLVWAGLPFVVASGYLGVHLTIEQTFWTWDRGLQMVGFSLVHGLWILLFPVLLFGFIWGGVYITYAIWWHFSGGFFGTTFLIVFILGLIFMNIPYSFWQHAFFDKLVNNPLN